MGETVKAKRPTKNPKEEKIANPTGDEGYGYVGKAQKIIDSINAVFDALKKYDYTEEDQLRDYVADLNARLKNLTTKLENRQIKPQKLLIG
jgi:alpha-D-ribose 1-methylphosphonate 5-triphosphate synthase subunit PhnG